MSALHSRHCPVKISARVTFGVVSSVGHMQKRIAEPANNPGPIPPYHAATSTNSDSRSWAVPFA